MLWMRTRSEIVMQTFPSLSLRRPVDPFGEDNGVGFFIADGLVEGAGLHMLAPDQQLQFRHAGRAQPGLGGVHDGAAKAFPLAVGIDGDVIDPAAMAVM